jgi:hypothetical protein
VLGFAGVALLRSDHGKSLARIAVLLPCDRRPGGTERLAPMKLHLNHWLEDLRASARYDRERRDLYRAKIHRSRVTSPERLHELERAAARSELRLQRAERDARDATGDAAGPDASV